MLQHTRTAINAAPLQTVRVRAQGAEHQQNCCCLEPVLCALLRSLRELPSIEEGPCLPSGAAERFKDA
jgi:hypothetical protein